MTAIGISILFDGLEIIGRGAGIGGGRACKSGGVDRDRSAGADADQRRGCASAGVDHRLVDRGIDQGISESAAVGRNGRGMGADSERITGPDGEQCNRLARGGLGGLSDGILIIGVGSGRRSAGEGIGENIPAAAGIHDREGGIAGAGRKLLDGGISISIGLRIGAAKSSGIGKHVERSDTAIICRGNSAIGQRHLVQSVAVIAISESQAGRACQSRRMKRDRPVVDDFRNCIAAVRGRRILADPRVNVGIHIGLARSIRGRGRANVDRCAKAVGDLGRCIGAEEAVDVLLDYELVESRRGGKAARGEGMGIDVDHAAIVDDRFGQGRIRRCDLRNRGRNRRQRMSPSGRDRRRIAADLEQAIIVDRGDRVAAIGIGILLDGRPVDRRGQGIGRRRACKSGGIDRDRSANPDADDRRGRTKAGIVSRLMDGRVNRRISVSAAIGRKRRRKSGDVERTGTDVERGHGLTGGGMGGLRDGVLIISVSVSRPAAGEGIGGDASAAGVEHCKGGIAGAGGILM